MEDVNTQQPQWVSAQAQRAKRYFRRRWRSAILYASLQINLLRLRAIRRKAGLRRRIVAIMLVEHLGDIIACEPVSRAMRQSHPDSYIIWVCRRPYRELLQSNPNLDGVLVVTCLDEALYLAQRRVFDEVINLHVNLRWCNWRGTSFHRVDGDPSVTLLNYYDFGALLEAFSRAAGLAVLSSGPQFHFAPGISRRTQSHIPNQPFLVLHAATNEGGRDWSAAKWQALLAKLRTNSKAILVEIGLKPVVSVGNDGVINLCGRLSLQSVAELIRRSTGFIGIDSGPAHIANALQTRSIILLGHYLKWKHYTPYTGFFQENASRMLIHWDGPASDIPVDYCAARIRAQWPELFSDQTCVADASTAGPDAIDRRTTRPIVP